MLWSSTFGNPHLLNPIDPFLEPFKGTLIDPFKGALISRNSHLPVLSLTFKRAGLLEGRCKGHGDVLWISAQPL